MWSPEAVDCEDHMEQVDDLVLTESDQKYLGDQEPYDILNYALRGSLKIASIVRYVQQSVLPEMEELREKEEQSEQLIKT
ncbi:hypothetical protein, partial [Bradyrhizobium sp. TM233]|uniref:hypothetical protein n=1 Tax=Bradyrhizobium sp. TM233 TaxID=2599801 RepID=UPI0030C70C10